MMANQRLRQWLKLPRFVTRAALAFFLIIFPLYPAQCGSAPGPFPEIVAQWIAEQHSLPRYEEAYYSPLGRSPVIDAVLGDPYYLPMYAERVSQALKNQTQLGGFQGVCRQCFLAGGIPEDLIETEKEAEKVPQEFFGAFGEAIARDVYRFWRAFILVSKECESILAPLTLEEKQWILSNREAFFFGYPGNTEYQFFTTKNPMPLKFFALAARIDLARLTGCSLALARIADGIRQKRIELGETVLESDFTWEEEGRKLIVSSRSDTTFVESADMFLHLGGNSKFLGNAGGTEGKRPAALHICLKGNNVFSGKHFVQGAGILGSGLLANFEGNNTYLADSYAQGAGFFGTGLLLDLGGNNNFQIDYFGQSCALFGSAVLWNRQGASDYIAHDGMAQGASSTLGVAFLIDGAGDSAFVLGKRGSGGNNKAMGIGQGGSVGVRCDPWKSRPSFYGGLSFLFSEGGRNRYYGAWYAQGSAYFLGAGILVDQGKPALFSAEINSQGQGLHLAAGLLLTATNAARLEADWGSMGVGADRSAGMLIATDGGGTFKGGVQTLGTSRKPQGLGVFINLGGGASYLFGAESCANIQLPGSPAEWSQALFLNLGKASTYVQGVDAQERCHNCRWGVENMGIGSDWEARKSGLFEALLEKLPKNPRVAFPFDPLKGWQSNNAFRPLFLKNTLQRMQQIDTFDYEQRRHLYEALDLHRFTSVKGAIDPKLLLTEAALAREDQFNYAVLWGLNDNDHTLLPPVMDALQRGLLRSPYAEKMGVRLSGSLGKTSARPLLQAIMKRDVPPETKASAAYFLAKYADRKTAEWLVLKAIDAPELVRFAIAYGLQDTTLPQGVAVLLPFLNDRSVYVRRAAALSAISYRYKQALPLLWDTLDYPSLDLTVNYGDNLFSKLSKYLGVDFGIDREAWLAWWEENGASFTFPEQKFCGEVR